VGRRGNMFGWTDIDDDANMFIVKALEWTKEWNSTMTEPQLYHSSSR
jgi:hypothetical protein